MDPARVIQQNLADPVYFCQHFLSEWFPEEIPWFHRGMLAIMTRRCGFLTRYGELDKILRHFVWSPNPFDPEPKEYPIFAYIDGQMHMTISPNTAFMLPRGFSKTTLCNAKNTWKILHNLTRFVLYISESGPHAITQLGNVKTQLETNEMILKFYGSLVGAKWTETEIVCANGVYVVCRGRGGQIRGLLKDGARPDDITIDDMEDEESVQTPEQRQKAKGFLYKAVMPALARNNPNATLNMLGTLLHREAVLMTVANDPRFNFIRFSALDRDGNALWPTANGMTLEKLEQEKISATIAGELSGYYMEYMSKLSDASTAPFKNISHMQLPTNVNVLGVALAVDPAISQNKTADFFSIAAVVMTQGGRFFVVDNFMQKGVLPRAQVDKVFEMYSALKLRFPGIGIKVGIESIAYQKALVHLVREEMFRKHCYFEIEGISHGNTTKDARIKGVLQPRYANQYVVHERVFPELESQLLDYPNGKKDGPDAVAMAVALLDPYAAAAVGDHDLTADVYTEEEDDVELTFAP